MPPKTSGARRHARIPTTASVQVVWQDASGHSRFATVQAFEVSESGLRIALPEPLRIQSYVSLQAAKLGLQGRASVRYCNRAGAKYVIGLEFAAGLRWKARGEAAASAAVGTGAATDDVQ